MTNADIHCATINTAIQTRLLLSQDTFHIFYSIHPFSAQISHINRTLFERTRAQIIRAYLTTVWDTTTTTTTNTTEDRHHSPVMDLAKLSPSD